MRKRDKTTEEEIEAAVRFILPELQRFAPKKKPEYADDVREVIRRCFRLLGIDEKLSNEHLS